MSIVKRKFYKILLSLAAFTLVLVQVVRCSTISPLEKILKAPLEKRLKMDKNKIFPLVDNLSKGERLAFWAEFYVGVPYDTIPIGLYVKEKLMRTDSSLDCMSHTFTSYELALAKNNEEAMNMALTTRFINKGVAELNGKVKTYDGRFEYGEDMSFSGKYGKNITAQLGKVSLINGSRTHKRVEILETDEAVLNIDKLRSGDIIFFVKNPKKRKIDEIVGHIGIIKREGKQTFLIHASGSKAFKADTTTKTGQVKKVPFKEYLKKNNTFFTGIIVNRIDS